MADVAFSVNEIRDFALLKAWTIRGKTTLPDGAPIQGSRITPKDDGSRFSFTTTDSDENYSYRLA